MSKKIILNTITILFALLFLYSSTSKLFEYKEFITQARQSPFLKVMPEWVIWIIPAMELLAVIMLAAKHWRLSGLYFCCLLMLAFTTYIIVLSQLSNYIPCSCGLGLDSIPQPLHLFLNCVLILFAIFGIYLKKNRSTHSYNNIAQDLPHAP